jgi:hypothetical protein
MEKKLAKRRKDSHALSRDDMQTIMVHKVCILNYGIARCRACGTRISLVCGVCTLNCGVAWCRACGTHIILVSMACTLNIGDL